MVGNKYMRGTELLCLYDTSAKNSQNYSQSCDTPVIQETHSQRFYNSLFWEVASTHLTYTLRKIAGIAWLSIPLAIKQGQTKYKKK